MTNTQPSHKRGLMFFQIPRCYDSHIHLLATGQMENTLQLSSLQKPEDIQKLIVEKKYFNKNWLIGFGWDQNLWPQKEFPSVELLDKIFPNFPVAFFRADGHALWTNTIALQLAGIQSKKILIDHEMLPVQNLIPQPDRLQKEKDIRTGINKMNQAGFTHFRDMAGDEEQWSILYNLDQRKSLTAYIEQNFYLENIESLSKIIKSFQTAKQNETRHLRTSAIKIYYDGALGSEGALISQKYQGRDHQGLRLLELSKLKEIFIQCWENQIPVAIHSIGDLAAEEISLAACDVYEKGYRGKLHLEHGELIQSKTIKRLSEIDVTVHMQPSHWLSDKRWLKEKIGSLYQHAFPWADLKNYKISFYWGSDAPIEMPSLYRTYQALLDSEKHGIKSIHDTDLSHHRHPDLQWGSQCCTTFNEKEVLSVIFDQQEILKLN